MNITGSSIKVRSQKAITIYFLCVFLILCLSVSTGFSDEPTNNTTISIGSKYNKNKTIKKIKKEYNSNKKAEKSDNNDTEEAINEFYGLEFQGEDSTAVYDEKSLQGSYENGRFSASQELNLDLAKVGYNYDARAGVFFKQDENGELIEVAGADIEIGAKLTVIGANYAGEISYGGDLAQFNAKIEAEAEAVAEGKLKGEFTISEDGVNTGAGVDLFAGARASAKGDISVTVLGMKVELLVEGEASAGIGAAAGFAFELTKDGLLLNASAAATLGIGVGGNVAVKVDPSELMKKLGIDSETVFIAMLEKFKELDEAVEMAKEVAVEVLDDLEDGVNDYLVEPIEDCASFLSNGWKKFRNYVGDRVSPPPVNPDQAQKAGKYAFLSEQIYDNSLKKGSIVKDSVFGSWQVVDDKANSSTGFHGVLFENIDTKEKILIFEGTDPEIVSMEFAKDAVMDLGNMLAPSRQDSEALQYANELVARYPGETISVGGHSLGGQLAMVVAGAYGWDAYTFNASWPAFMTSVYCAKHGFKTNGIHNYVENSDWVNQFTRIVGVNGEWGEIIFVDFTPGLDLNPLKAHSSLNFVDYLKKNAVTPTPSGTYLPGYLPDTDSNNNEIGRPAKVNHAPINPLKHVRTLNKIVPLPW